ncbi:MAG TPA: dihydrodipicolinate synthase family protein [Acetobacteraceae bacterium]
MVPFDGLIAYPITPADAAGRVDTLALRRLLERLAAAGVQGIGLLGSTGAYPYFTRAERRRAIEAAVDALAGRVPLLVGVGALRTDEAVALASDARAAGAGAGLLAPVSYIPLRDDEVFAHYEAVAATGLGLCIYDNPATTGFTFSPALIGRLSRVPGIQAAKVPAPQAEAPAALAALRAGCAPGFRVGCSVDARAAEALLAGADAWHSVAAGLFPRACLALSAAARAGDAAGTRRLNTAMQPLWDLFAAHTSLRAIYAAAGHLGLCDAAPPPPVLPLPDEARHQVADVVDRLGLA